MQSNNQRDWTHYTNAALREILMMCSVQMLGRPTRAELLACVQELSEDDLVRKGIVNPDYDDSKPCAWTLLD